MNFALPQIGEGVYEAEVVRWLVEPGDAVKRCQNLLEVMTDKATMEVPAPFPGVVTALRVEPGQRIKVGQVVLEYDPAGSAPDVSLAENKSASVAASARFLPAGKSNGAAQLRPTKAGLLLPSKFPTQTAST